MCSTLSLDVLWFFSFFLPIVYSGRGTLEEGETAEARFIKIQAAYELLINEERRRAYDNEHRVNPMKVQFSAPGTFDNLLTLWVSFYEKLLNIFCPIYEITFK